MEGEILKGEGISVIFKLREKPSGPHGEARPAENFRRIQRACVPNGTILKYFWIISWYRAVSAGMGVWPPMWL